MAPWTYFERADGFSVYWSLLAHIYLCDNGKCQILKHNVPSAKFIEDLNHPNFPADFEQLNINCIMLVEIIH